MLRRSKHATPLCSFVRSKHATPLCSFVLPSVLPSVVILLIFPQSRVGTIVDELSSAVKLKAVQEEEDDGACQAQARGSGAASF